MYRMRAVLFGLLLIPLGALYLWLALQATRSMQPGDELVSYAVLLIFLALGVGAVLAGINIVRTRRR